MKNYYKYLEIWRKCCIFTYNQLKLKTNQLWQIKKIIGKKDMIVYQTT